MLIRSQSGYCLINVDKVTSIMIIPLKSKSCDIVIEDNIYMGVYSSNEKALKVLDMIEKQYISCNGEYRNQYVGSYGYIKNKVFKMPQDDEV